MPSAPTIIFTPAGTPTPSAPGAVFTPAGMPTPAAPGAVFSGPPAVGIPNSLETDFTGAINNDMRFEQVGNGAAPTLQFSSTGSFAFPIITVSVAGGAINVTLQTAIGQAIATAGEIIAAVNTSSAAAALVVASNKAGNDGSGGLGSAFTFGPTALSGGSANPAAPPAIFIP